MARKDFDKQQPYRTIIHSTCISELQIYSSVIPDARMWRRTVINAIAMIATVPSNLCNETVRAVTRLPVTFPQTPLSLNCNYRLQPRQPSLSCNEIGEADVRLLPAGTDAKNILKLTSQQNSSVISSSDIHTDNSQKCQTGPRPAGSAVSNPHSRRNLARSASAGAGVQAYPGNQSVMFSEVTIVCFNFSDQAAV